MSMSQQIHTVTAVVIHSRLYGGTELWNSLLGILGHDLGGVTVLASVKHDFPNGAISGTVLLAESHASLHSWPELSKTWYELATCGDPADIERFVAALGLLGDVRDVSRSATDLSL